MPALSGDPARRECGSALVEAAIVLPCLVLILHWSVALTELLLVRLKAGEAARRALWETTIGRAPRFVEESGSGLWSSRPLRFRTSIGLRAALGPIPRAFDGAARRFGLDMGGAAAVRARLEEVPLPGWVLPGGDLPWRRGSGDFGRPASLAAVEAPVASAAPLHIVFDTWTGWPPAGADVAATYDVVEREVGRRVSAIAYFGIRSGPLAHVASAVEDALGTSAGRAVFGGRAPDVFATGRMDDAKNPGPISILPSEKTRAGDVLSSAEPPRLRGEEAFSDGEDSPRATVPFRIYGRYWTRSGGSDGDRGTATEPYPARLTEKNAYVTSWNCRGRFFAGATHAEEPELKKRYRAACR